MTHRNQYHGGKRSLFLILLTLMALNLSAQDRMIPSYIRALKSSRTYETNLLEYFDIGEADRFAYLVKPSFREEYCISYNRKTKSLILKRATMSISNFGEGNPKKNILAETSRLTISDSLADSIHALFAAAVLTSSYMGDTLFGLDGETYQFILNPGYSMTAECWSPDSNTNCGQAVAIIEKLCKAVEAEDRKAAESLMREIVRVTNLFRQYYPEDFHQEKHFCGRSQ